MTPIKEREQARLELQARLDAAKTQAERNRLGQFATPSSLASDIVAYALFFIPPRVRIRFLEPGFGTGPFYSALLSQVPPSHIKAAVGYEIDPDSAEPARSLWDETGLRLHISDFTTAEPPRTEATKFSLVVCNPPYVRHHHLSQTQKRNLQRAIARYLNFEMNGLGGLYTYFMILSQAWMTTNGVGAWLVPSEFMDVNYGRKVKEFLVDRVTLHRIHRFDPKDVQFGDALVSSAIVFFTNSPPPREHRTEFSFGGTLAEPRVADTVKITELRRISKWTALPQGMSRFTEKHKSIITLADLFVIKRGLATGCNAFFILTPEQVEEFNLPTQFLKPILPSPRELETDEIFADESGEPLIRNRRCLLDCDLPEDKVKVKYPSLWRYLVNGIKAGIDKGYLCGHREPWYSQELRPPSPFLCTYMGRATHKSVSPFRFILNHSKATAANVYLLLYPNPNLSAALGADPELFRRIWEALSSITADILTQEGRIYGGGLHKLEPKELANVSAAPILEILSESGEFKMHTQFELFSS